MGAARKLIPDSHVVDILGSTRGRDQPIMLMEKAMELVSSISDSTYADPNTVFLDPFCKAGEILLATAMRACHVAGHREPNLPTSDSLFNELYTGRYFALAPDVRHFLLTKRTFFGNERSHNSDITKYIKSGNYLSETDGTLDKSIFQRELDTMIEFIRKTKPKAKIVAIGNPPYQESDGGFGKSASPIYNYFVEALMDNGSISEFVLVIPSRWFSGGKGLNEFRSRILESNTVKAIQMFKDPREVFPTVDINGGVCFLAVDKNHSGDCKLIDGADVISAELSTLDAIPDDIAAYDLIGKIRKKCDEFMSDHVLPRNPFGITSTTLRGVNQSTPNGVKCMIKERQIIKIPKELVLKNSALVQKYKVVVPAAVGGTKAVRDFLPVNQFFIVEPNVALAETYIIVGTFDGRAAAEKLLAYLKTSFCRYFIGLRKLTQHLSQDCWSWVPKMDFSKEWNDEKLFAHFNLNKKEQDHIIKKVKEWS